MSETTLRDYILALTAVVVLVSLATSVYLFLVRRRFRLYLIPTILLLLHAAALFLVMFAHNFLGWEFAVYRYLINDWVPLLLLQVFITIGLYIVWMPLLWR